MRDSALHITLLCDHYLPHKPRSSRLLRLLRTLQAHTPLQLSIIHKALPNQNPLLDSEISESSSISFYHFLPDKTSKERTSEENDEIVRLCQRGAAGEIDAFKKLIFTPNRQKVREILHSLPSQHLLILEDITLLPFACEYKQHTKAKILIDLREFYPLEYENDAHWRSTLGQFFRHLCEAYLPSIDMALSVSNGLIKRYKRDFKIPCKLFYSLPPFFNLTPTMTNPNDIKLLYHGFISPDRESFELLHLAKALENSPYSLSVMALSNQKGFLEEFSKEAESLPALSMLPPVKMSEIIPASFGFDMGLLPFGGGTFNLQHCMPNKLFEYLQARLGLLATPLPDLGEFITSHHLGVIAKDFGAKALSEALFTLLPQDIDTFKQNAHAHAPRYQLESNRATLVEVLKHILGDDLRI